MQLDDLIEFWKMIAENSAKEGNPMISVRFDVAEATLAELERAEKAREAIGTAHDLFEEEE